MNLAEVASILEAAALSLINFTTPLLPFVVTLSPQFKFLSDRLLALQCYQKYPNRLWGLFLLHSSRRVTLFFIVAHASFFPEWEWAPRAVRMVLITYRVPVLPAKCPGYRKYLFLVDSFCVSL